MMSFKVFSYIALVVLIVQVTVSDAAPQKGSKAAVASNRAAQPAKNAPAPKVAAPAGSKTKCNCKKDANGKCLDPTACKSCPGCNPALGKKAVKAVNPPRVVSVKA